MVDTTVWDTVGDTDTADTDMADTGMAADTADTTVMANRFLNSNILPFFLITPLWSFRNLNYCPLQYY